MSNADPRGKFVWHELSTPDAAGAGAFYPRVLAWKSQPWERDPSYTIWVGKSGPVGGMMTMPEGATAPPRWLMYVGVADVAASVSAAKALGARVLKDTSEIPGAGTYAVLADPQGAEFAVYKSAEPHGNSASATGDFTWHELSTRDASAAMKFYTELFGWKVGPSHDMGAMGLYHLFLHDGQQHGGMFNSRTGDAPHWLCYVSVDDAGKAAAAAKAAGGRVINGPMEVPGGSWVAQIIDPAGVAFAIQELKKTQATPPPAAKPVALPKPKAPKPQAPAAVAAPAPSAPAVKPAAPAKVAVAAAPAKAAPKKAPAKRKAAAKSKAPAKKRKSKPKAQRKAQRKGKGKAAAKKAAGKKKSAAKRAPARKKKAAPAKRAAARKSTARRAKPKKHR